MKDSYKKNQSQKSLLFLSIGMIVCFQAGLR